MQTYKHNVERVHEFYDSDFYKRLKVRQPEYIRNICKAIMEDPDAVDEELLAEKVQQLQNSDIAAHRHTALQGNVILSLDCVTGWKAIFDAHNGEREWIDDYAEIRQHLSAHFLWPRHGSNTINTVRYKAFKDRIDYTLYDIKMFFAGKEDLRLQAVYDDPVTSSWLHAFGSFENLVQTMCLGCFCVNNTEIINLSDTSSRITGYEDNRYR